MTEISAIDAGTAGERGGLERASGTMTGLSFLLTVGLPTIFWMGVLELANYALSIGLSNVVRMAVAGTLIALLTMIWGFIMISARHGQSREC